MNREHSYELTVTWTGNRGTGTSTYRSYGRDHVVSGADHEDILGSADRVFHGERSRWNPEQLLLAALSQCHLLSYLHVASSAGVVVTDYVDHPTGTMVEDGHDGGQFTSVTLNPEVRITDPTQIELANSLHEKANALCFIARSVNFPVHHKPTTTV